MLPLELFTSSVFNSSYLKVEKTAVKVGRIDPNRFVSWELKKKNRKLETNPL